ncbi:MAG: hypothetical protein O6940_00840 [Ignavibacteria bacterium]|nr:hypothetical protein [Ignavibacteria bacterium]
MSKAKKDFELLSAYLDDELSPNEVEQLKRKIKSSLELQKKLEDLQQIKKLTSSSYKNLPESPYFETRLFARIELQKVWYKRVFRWSPAIGLGAIAIILMVILKFNPDVINNLINQQKSNVAGFYKENLQPLLFAADLNNEDIFNFAMYKKLPLDTKDKQYIHLGYDDAGKEYVEIKNLDIVQEENNYEKFLLALELNEDQIKQMDSIINQYAVELEAQVLVNRNNTIAINSNLWNYQRAIQSDLLTFAENFNENKFHKFVPSTIPFSKNPIVVNVVREIRTARNNNYIILTPDSIFSDNIEFDPEEYKSFMRDFEAELSGQDAALKDQEGDLKEQVGRLKDINFHMGYDSSWKKLKYDYSWNKDFKISFDSNLCRVEISDFNMPDVKILNFDSLFSAYDSVANNFKFYSHFIPRIEYLDNMIKFHFDGDSSQSFEFKYHVQFDTDSLVQFQSDLLDTLKYFNWNNFYDFNDSLAFNSMPEFDKFFNFNESNGEIRLEMEELKKELQQFRKEMKDWKKKFKREFKSHDKLEDES